MWAMAAYWAAEEGVDEVVDVVVGPLGLEAGNKGGAKLIPPFSDQQISYFNVVAKLTFSSLIITLGAALARKTSSLCLANFESDSRNLWPDWDHDPFSVEILSNKELTEKHCNLNYMHTSGIYTGGTQKTVFVVILAIIEGCRCHRCGRGRTPIATAGIETICVIFIGVRDAGSEDGRRRRRRRVGRRSDRAKMMAERRAEGGSRRQWRRAMFFFDSVLQWHVLYDWRRDCWSIIPLKYTGNGKNLIPQIIKRSPGKYYEKTCADLARPFEYAEY
uniref:Uncharacterized protein n=1 Tax=Romanomermis culicivorax TaxID=13658 RepID=A0A915KLV1_ROMCU